MSRTGSPPGNLSQALHPTALFFYYIEKGEMLGTARTLNKMESVNRFLAFRLRDCEHTCP